MSRMMLITILMISLMLIVTGTAGQTEAYFILYEDLEGSLFGFDTETNQNVLLVDATEIVNRQLTSTGNGHYAAIVASNIIPGLEGVLPDIRATLYLVDLRDGTRLLTRELLSPEYEYLPDENRYYEQYGYFSYDRFVEGYGGPTVFWSPDQTRLVWTEGTAVGNEARLGMYSIVDDHLMIFPEGQGVPTNFDWSPEGSYLKYEGLYSTGSGAGQASTGMLFITPDLRQIKPPDDSDRSQLDYQWVTDAKYLYSQLDIRYDGRNALFIYDAAEDVVVDVIPPGPLKIISSYFEPATSRFVFTLIEYATEYGDDDFSYDDYEASLYRLEAPFITPQHVLAFDAYPVHIYSAGLDEAYIEDYGFINLLTGDITEGTMALPTSTPEASSTPLSIPEVPAEYLPLLLERPQDGYMMILQQ